MLLANKLMRDAAKVAVKNVDCKRVKDDPEAIDAMLEAMKAKAKEMLACLIERYDVDDIEKMDALTMNGIYITMVRLVALAGEEAVK